MVQTRLSSIRKERVEKAEKLRELGVDPYPSFFDKKQTCGEVAKLLGKRVKTAGRIMAIRGHGKISFFDLVDQSGKIQVWLQESKLNNYKLTKLLDVGDFIGVGGKVIKTKAGETTIDVNDIQVLSKALRPLPDQWHGLKDIEERYRRRYIDLNVGSGVRDIFVARARILLGVRKFLDDNGFLEVETPVLQPMYGGASARPFTTHHNALDHDFYLRISDELYLKRLIVGGFEKVYEVSRDFRNEGIDRFHNPEFTQVEFYWAYADYKKLMEFTQEMLTWVIKDIKGNLKVTYQGQIFDFKLPWKRVTFAEVLRERTGIELADIKTEKDLKEGIKKRNLRLDLKGVIGLGALYDRLYKTFIRPFLKEPVFLTDYPAAMIALAKRKENNNHLIASFQLLVNGTELVKAYNELNDPIDQRNRWIEEEKLIDRGAEETERLDEDYIEALEYGMPLTAGWGMGIDRLAMFLTDQPTLKDVILFPTLKPKTV